MNRDSISLAMKGFSFSSFSDGVLHFPLLILYEAPVVSPQSVSILIPVDPNHHPVKFHVESTKSTKFQISINIAIAHNYP